MQQSKNVLELAPEESLNEQLEAELAAQKDATEEVRRRNMALKHENLRLREKLLLLERLDLFAAGYESACVKTLRRVAETY